MPRAFGRCHLNIEWHATEPITGARAERSMKLVREHEEMMMMMMMMMMMLWATGMLHN
jgi:hypothetical protein